MGTMAAPVCYSFLWITIFGGAGERLIYYRILKVTIFALGEYYIT